MMANRKSLFCNSCGNPLEDDGTCKMCPAGNKRRRSPAESINRTCPWNDHGDTCGLVGSMIDSTNGQGPWYCSKHFWKLKGYTPRVVDAAKPKINFREQWFLDNKQPYEPPNLDHCIGFRSVGNHAPIPVPKIGREPGEDLDEAA
jgi:hypothetical protein